MIHLLLTIGVIELAKYFIDEVLFSAINSLHIEYKSVIFQT